MQLKQLIRVTVISNLTRTALTYFYED